MDTKQKPVALASPVGCNEAVVCGPQCVLFGNYKEVTGDFHNAKKVGEN